VRSPADCDSLRHPAGNQHAAVVLGALDAHWLVRLDYLRINDTGASAVTGRFSVNLASVGVSFIF